MPRIFGEMEDDLLRVTLVSHSPPDPTTPDGYDVEYVPDPSEGEGELYYDPENEVFLFIEEGEEEE